MKTLGRDEIFAVVRRNAASVLSIQADTIPLKGKLVDLGANSIDRMEIVTMTMEALGLRFSLVELAQVENIEELVGFLHEKSKVGAA